MKAEKQVKCSMNPTVLILIAVSALVPSLALAVEGHSGGNGGDPVLLRAKLIKEFINSELRADAAAYMQNTGFDQVSSIPARDALKDMVARDVATDIQESTYLLKDSCQDVGGQAGGGAIANDLGGDICLSAKRLAEIDASKAEIVGLIIHEHAHHFGYVDANYAIYKAVYQTVSLSNPSWSSADPSNPPAPILPPLPQPPALGMNFVKLGPASFLMGSPENEAIHQRDEVQHLVYLSQSFEIQTTDVTQAQYIKVMSSNPSYFRARQNCPESFTTIQGVAACPNYPVEEVSYDDVQLFISRLNAAQRGQSFYRLPTEAEWEYAARGGSQTAYSFGSDPSQLYQYSWFDRNSGSQAHAVAQLKPNKYGLYDMQGNVWQWVQDCYGDYPQSSVTDPQGSTSSECSDRALRVVRGGSWGNLPEVLRSARRNSIGDSARVNLVGFRLVKTP